MSGYRFLELSSARPEFIESIDRDSWFEKFLRIVCRLNKSPVIQTGIGQVHLDNKSTSKMSPTRKDGNRI